MNDLVIVLTQGNGLSFLASIGREKVHTPPNGDCAVIAFLQTCLYNNGDDVMVQNSPLIDTGRCFAVSASSAMRQTLVRYLRSEDPVGKILYSCLSIEGIVQLQALLRTQHNMVRQWERMTTISDFVEYAYGRNYDDGGIWLDSFGLRALALSKTRNVVVVTERNGNSSCTLYNGQPCDEFVNPRQRLLTPRMPTHANFQPGLPLTTTSATTIVPAYIFDRNTVVIVYNGTNHFEATRPLHSARDMSSLAQRANERRTPFEIQHIQQRLWALP
jgi:hypothetical protein